jgi:broad specificity phosphatase PhoE
LIRLIFIRHGNTFSKTEAAIQIGARTDLSLTAEGQEQARQVTKYLIKTQIRPLAIFSGALKRQLETAQIIANEFPLEVQRLNRNTLKTEISDHNKASLFSTCFDIEACLTEIDYGPWEGLSASQIAQIWPNEYDLWIHEAAWPHEIFGECAHRRENLIYCWLQNLCKMHKQGHTVLGITSAGVLRLLYRYANGCFSHGCKVQTGHFCVLQLRAYEEITSQRDTEIISSPALIKSLTIELWNCVPEP